MHAPRIASRLLIVLLSCVAGVAAGGPPISFELIMENGFPQEKSRDWMEVLKEHRPASLRFIGGGGQPEVTNRGTDKQPRYHVVGVLTRDNQLLLPNGRFRPSDRAAIGVWISKLESGGPDELTAKRGVFGMTTKELVKLHEELAVKVVGNTKGKRPIDVAREAIRGLTLPVTVDPAATRALSALPDVADEMSGLTAGTVLAGVLRPAGVVLVPQKTSKGFAIQIVESRQVKEYWPVGLPPDKAPKDTMPNLFKFLKVEIDDTALGDALSAIQGRLEAPLLIDHAALTRQGIDLSKVSVSLPSSNTYYKRILDRLLSQAKLTCDVRVDEAGTSFLWVTSISTKD